MKRPHVISAAIAVATVLHYGAVLGAEPAAKDREIGKWELQLSKSHFCNPAAAPQKSARDIVDAGGSILMIHWTGVDPKGKPVDIHYVLRYDGKKYAFPSDVADPEVYISWKRISPSEVAFIDWSKDGKKLAENTRTLSEDGNTMTQSTTAVDASGHKAACTDHQVFERQQ
jgi:hypothetical protein